MSTHTGNLGIVDLNRRSIRWRSAAAARKAARWTRILEQEIQIPVRISPLSKLDLLRRGFLSQSAVLYAGLANDPSLYLSDLQRLATAEIDGDYVPLLRNKVLFHQLLTWHGFGGHLPALLGLVQAPGRLQANETRIETGIAEAVLLYLDQGRSLILKPLGGGGGLGVIAITTARHGTYWNGDPVGTAELAERLNRLPVGYGVWEMAIQADYARQINPSSANTMRILTMWDYENQEPFIAIAVHRFGTRKSQPADNWKAGGICAHIDISSGEIGPAVANPGRERKLTWHEHHPDTGLQISGVRIAGWEEITKFITTVAAKLWFLPYVGWDVLSCADGIKIIEGNHVSDVNLLQVHRPLLADPRIRKFYVAHGIIPALQPTGLSPR